MSARTHVLLEPHDSHDSLRFSLCDISNCSFLIFITGKNFKLQKVNNVFFFVIINFLITIWQIVNFQIAFTKLPLEMICDCTIHSFYISLRLILNLFSYLPVGFRLLYKDFSVGLCFTSSCSNFQYISQFLHRITCFGEEAGHRTTHNHLKFKRRNQLL